jgi:hypothetical protein
VVRCSDRSWCFDQIVDRKQVDRNFDEGYQHEVP